MIAFRNRRSARVLVTAAIAAAASAAPLRAEAPVRPAVVWRLDVAPDPGFIWSYGRTVAVRRDGGALAMLTQSRDVDGKTEYRLVALGIERDGKLLARSAPTAEPLAISDHASAVDRDGYVLAHNGPKGVSVFRLAGDGKVRAVQALRLKRGPTEITGIMADPRGTIIVFGGTDEGPHAPAMASLDAGGRLLWHFAGAHPMPPGGVPAMRFRGDGGTDAIVIDRETPYWERRTKAGALAGRVRLASRHWHCRAFLGDGRLADLFFNWAEQPVVPGPLKQWVLAVSSPPGRVLPGHRALDVAEAENALCHLAVNDSGWIAASVDPAKIVVFDAALTPRAEIDLSPAFGAQEGPKDGAGLDALAIDVQGAVTAILRTGPRGDGRAVLRYAALPR